MNQLCNIFDLGRDRRYDRHHGEVHAQLGEISDLVRRTKKKRSLDAAEISKIYQSLHEPLASSANQGTSPLLVVGKSTSLHSNINIFHIVHGHALIFIVRLERFMRITHRLAMGLKAAADTRMKASALAKPGIVSGLLLPEITRPDQFQPISRIGL